MSVGSHHLFHSLYRGNLFLERHLDAAFQRHRCHRAPTTCAGAAALHHTPPPPPSTSTSSTSPPSAWRAGRILSSTLSTSNLMEVPPFLISHYYTMSFPGPSFLDENQSADSIS